MRRGTGESSSSDRPVDLEAALTQPWPGLKADEAKRFLAEARAQLHSKLVETLRSSGARDCVPALETAFIQFGKAALTQVAEIAKADDAESCLEQLRLHLIPLIIAAIEPDAAHQEMTYDERAHDIVGEWEVRLEKAYESFGCEFGSSSQDDIAFRYQIIFRLRDGIQREALRGRLHAVLSNTLIEAEAALRRRLPARKAAPLRARGYEADAARHILVAEIVGRFGGDWRRRLPEVCEALGNAVVALPSWHEEESIDTWSDIAQFLGDDPRLRNRVLEHIRYCVRWVEQKRRD